MKNLTFIIPLFFSIFSYSQVGPSLTGGAGGLVYNQGQLDAQLILDIIATKKGEVKAELGQRLILKKLEGGPYALYNYAEKNLDLLFSEGNKSTVTKEFMQNSAELLLVYGLAEYILQDISAGSGSKDSITITFLNRLCYEAGKSNRDTLLNRFRLQSLKEIVDNAQKLINDSIIPSLDTICKTSIGGSIKLNKEYTNLRKKIATVQEIAKSLSDSSSINSISRDTTIYSFTFPKSTDSTKYKSYLDSLCKDFRKNINVAKTTLDTILEKKKWPLRFLDKKDGFANNDEGLKNDEDLKNKYKVTTLNSAPLTSSTKYLLKPEITPYLTNENYQYQEGKNKYYTGMSMLVDLIYDACLHNEEVKSTGMFQSHQIDDARYKVLNKYLYFGRENPNSKIYKSLDNYKPKIDTLLSFLFGYYNLFEKYQDFYVQPNKKELDNLINQSTFDSDRINDLIESLKTEINGAKLTSTALNTDVLKNNMSELNRVINSFPIYFKTHKKPKNTYERTIAAKSDLDIAYSLEKDVIPLLRELNSVGTYDGALDTANKLTTELFENGLWFFKQDTNKIYTSINNLHNYLPLLHIINNLDKVESYDYMFKFLTGIGETIGDGRTKAVVQAITNGVDKYTTMDKENNKIVMDVEGFAVGVYDRFAKNQHSRLSLMLSVGANYNVTLNSSKNITETFNFINGTDTTKTSQFISEKIGLKLNIIDWNRRRNFGSTKKLLSKRRAPKQGHNPIVDDLHMMLYGSGLLYQIEVLNSADEFKTAIVGSGIGITFFNGLDFNISYAVPHTFNFDKGFMCISFDIALTEYLSELRLRQKKG